MKKTVAPRRAPSNLNWYQRGVDGGQIVEVHYAYEGDYAYRRCFDHSDRTTSYEVGEIDWGRQSEGIDYDAAPRVVEWEDCLPPEEVER